MSAMAVTYCCITSYSFNSSAHHEQTRGLMGESGHRVWSFSRGLEAICPKTPQQDRWCDISSSVSYLHHWMLWLDERGASSCLCRLTFITDRQRCALWIKKLCDPATCGSGLRGRKNRNMYARLLIHMLKRGVLELPFTCKPGPGSLKTLPTYMVRIPSIDHEYFYVE